MKPFSLIEVILVVAILGVALGSSALFLPRLFTFEAFEKSVERVEERLYLAKKVSFAYNMPVVLEMTQRKGTLECRIVTPLALPKKIAHFLNRNCLLKGIETLIYKGEKKESLKIEFEPTVYLGAKEEITFQGKGGTKATLHFR